MSYRGLIDLSCPCSLSSSFAPCFMTTACFRARVWWFVYMVSVHCSRLYVMHGIIHLPLKM